MTVKKLLTLEKQDNIAVLWMGIPEEEWNKITIGMISHFEEIIEEIQNDDEIVAAVFISRKKGFMAGADIEEFLTLGQGEGKKTSIQGHKMFAKIEDSKKPFVAAIHGACMGGGTEISLSCAGRVISSHSSTMMALPEVKLGLLPGLGGSFRMPRLIGLQKALNIILTGKNVYAYPAYKMGLADVIVDQANLLQAAKKHALNIVSGKFKRKDKRSLAEKILEGNSITRNIIFSKARQMVMRTTYGNYPAPLKIIETVKAHWNKPREESWEIETSNFDILLQSNECYQLIHLFFAMNAMKKNPKKELVKKVDTVAVLGAGLMGEGIAEVSVSRGMDILLKDLYPESLTKAKKNIWRNLSKKIKQKSIKSAEAETLINKVNTSTDFTGFQKADMVIEAVFEDINIKHQVIRETEQYIPTKAIFASNTSALPITKIAEASSRPEQVIGMHYFSPVQKMPLLEIITTDHTTDWVTATALDVGIRQGKTCIVVKDGPGFYTTRILSPFLNEALLLLEEGADILHLDKAMKQFGFPVGPINLIDEVGIDVGAHISEGALGAFFEQRGEKSNNKMRELADAGFKGRKNNNGFLLYDPKTGKKVRGKVNEEIYQFFGGNSRKNIDTQVIQDRMALMMINEAAMCLEEGIIQSPRDGDIGAIFGLGFAPFTGGPFRYLDHIGLNNVLSVFEKYKDLGNRFIPAKTLVDYAKERKKFY
ncbi:3-hydroxyacyl-CoA dehydrogenase NAD-binding domain-containing protein [Reichenbachiella sp. MALMAid0571]|uniref:3-hydroxyacyl-CoA dehydrogenase NAD-binding domain-containing protein n=1 Tax=Reichenbachiella sp. MALMAid0571 TaxID=3143939 RepID=UPI0032E025F5